MDFYSLFFFENIFPHINEKDLSLTVILILIVVVSDT